MKDDVNISKLYRELWDEVLYTVGLKYTEDLQMAEDLCQNGWIKVFEKIEMWDETGSIQGWVKKVIRNSILDELRKKNKKIIDKEINWELIDIPMDSPYVEFEFSAEDVMRVVNNLSEQYKNTFTLYLDGLSHKQISERLGISIGTSKSNLHKAKKNIRKYLTI